MINQTHPRGGRRVWEKAEGYPGPGWKGGRNRKIHWGIIFGPKMMILQGVRRLDTISWGMLRERPQKGWGIRRPRLRLIYQPLFEVMCKMENDGPLAPPVTIQGRLLFKGGCFSGRLLFRAVTIQRRLLFKDGHDSRVVTTQGRLLPKRGGGATRLRWALHPRAPRDLRTSSSTSSHCSGLAPARMQSSNGSRRRATSWTPCTNASLRAKPASRP